MDAGIDPVRVEAFMCALQESALTRISSELLWSAFARAFPHRPAGPSERALLLGALRALEASGAIRLPAEHGTRWDRSILPAVPASIDLVRDTEPAPSSAWRTFPWHPQLQWVTQCRGLSVEQIHFLRRVHEGFVERKFDEPAPLKYRSLQLTGDEKRLAALALTSLFGDARLSLEQLGCQPEPIPLAWESVGAGNRMLIFENADPFGTARRVLTALPARPYDAVAYGSGQSLSAALGHLKTLEQPFRALHYVGDLDHAGLEIAAFARLRCTELGLPALRPASELHREMLRAAAAFGHAEGWPCAERYSEAETARLVEALEPDLREPVVRILTRGHRVPEEVLGPAEFRAAWARSL